MRQLRLFQGYASLKRMADPEPAPMPAPSITADFTPGQSLALLKMRGSEFSLAVHAKLLEGTARTTLEDYVDLATMGFAQRQANGFHRLSPRGHFKANELARVLGPQVGIPVPTFTPDRRRGGFQPGVFSQNGNW